jgi:aspartyl protease family protein
MATGFMSRIIALFALAAAGAASGVVMAAEVALIGVIGERAAVVAIDGGDPKTIKVGQTWRGITVLSVEHERATIEIEGRRQVLQRGVHYRNAESSPPPNSRQSAILSADTRGHFIADGAVNGAPMRFLVDTGATAVSLPAADAARAGLDYRRGTRVSMQTANGTAPAYVMKLDRVRVGDIEVYDVDAVVVESGLPVALLGMSFLNRVEMRRTGATMTLMRLY